MLYLPLLGREREKGGPLGGGARERGVGWEAQGEQHREGKEGGGPTYGRQSPFTQRKDNHHRAPSTGKKSLAAIRFPWRHRGWGRGKLGLDPA